MDFNLDDFPGADAFGVGLDDVPVFGTEFLDFPDFGGQVPTFNPDGTGADFGGFENVGDLSGLQDFGSLQDLGGNSIQDFIDQQNYLASASPPFQGEGSPGPTVSAAASDEAFERALAGQEPEPANVLQRIGQRAGVVDDKGELKTDIGDPRTMDSWFKLLYGGLTLLGALQNRGRPAGYQTASELQKQIQTPFNTLNPQQQAAYNQFFYTPYKGPKAGGMVTNPAIVPSRGFKRGGALGMVSGVGGGQDDLVQARLSPGEYVMDAELVSALGDGDNGRGAQVLDRFREVVRMHKRDTPSDRIPPKAHPLEKYLRMAQGGKRG